MTKKEAAIVSAYTGVLIGDFAEMHDYAEKKLGRTILIHEFGSKKIANKLHELSKEDFCDIEVVE